MYFYLNGNLDFTFALTQPISTVTRSYNFIGKSYWSVDAPANGYYDEIKIFNKALSVAEIRYDKNINDPLTLDCKILLDQSVDMIYTTYLRLHFHYDHNHHDHNHYDHYYYDNDHCHIAHSQHTFYM